MATIIISSNNDNNNNNAVICCCDISECAVFHTHPESARIGAFSSATSVSDGDQHPPLRLKIPKVHTESTH